MQIGANFIDGRCNFTVWAPSHQQVNLFFPERSEQVKLEKACGGYWSTVLDGVKSNTQYMYQLDGHAVKPDPASYFQPDGVFGPSVIVDHEAYEWKDQDWLGKEVKESIFYELHVGCFTVEGTFKGVLGRVKELSLFGINAIELMPIVQFTGKRNWGYDGVFPYAVQNTYGSPAELKELVDECHQNNVALYIDLVYNHLGPEGNCLNDYGPYFPRSNMGRWGPTINLDGPMNRGVRNYFLQNALYWLSRYHLDGIRLDAILAMHDSSANPFLHELNQTVKQFAKKCKKKFGVIAELGGYNEPKVLASARGGFDFDGQWLEDFHHALVTLLTGEKQGYYRTYGRLQDLVEVLTEAYLTLGVDGGESKFKRAPSGVYGSIPACKFIAFSQNHDQIGNRLLGDRLISTVGFEAAKLAAGMVLLSPYVPLLFMGEEYGETAPFLFFTDYQDENLKKAVRVGRKQEFADFHLEGDFPDPQSAEAFEKSKINWQLRYSETRKKVATYYRTLIKLRGKQPLFHCKTRRQIKAVTSQDDEVLFILKESRHSKAGIIANFSNKDRPIAFPFKGGSFSKVVDSCDRAFGGSGPTLPVLALENDNLVIQAFNFSVFIKSKGEQDE